jgi:hypothetical protein
LMRRNNNQLHNFRIARDPNNQLEERNGIAFAVMRSRRNKLLLRYSLTIANRQDFAWDNAFQ